MESPDTRLRYRAGDNFAERLGTNPPRIPKPNGRQARPPSPTNSSPDSVSGPQPMFTVEESIVMRAVSAGKNDKQLCIDLRMPLQSFQGLLRDLMAKTGTSDRIGLLVWALRQKPGGDSREHERSYKWRRPAFGP